jgi:hypothetical protein
LKRSKGIRKINDTFRSFFMRDFGFFDLNILYKFKKK